MTMDLAEFGQEKIISFFERAISSGRIPHAIIINGEKNSGKLGLAKKFALECLKCEKDEHPDLKIIDLNGSGIKFIEKIRSELIGTIDLYPFYGEYKIYIIAGAGRMPREAQNALLKSIEEPPEYASIIMLTDTPGKLLPTIRSRAVQLNMKSLEKETVISLLCKHTNADKSIAQIAAAFSSGFPEKALNSLNDDTYVYLAENIPKAICELIRTKDYFSFKLETSDVREDLDKFIEFVEILMRDVLVYKSGNGSDSLLYDGWENEVAFMASKYSYHRIGNIIKNLRETKVSLRANVGKDALFELIMLEIGGIN